MANPDSITHSIYRIVCLSTGKCYVGQTIDTDQRKFKHLSLLRLNKHHSVKLQRAYTKYGTASFTIETLESGIPDSTINERERHWIEVFDSFNNGYNMDRGGQTHPNPRTVECAWNGIQYSCIADAARAIGVKETTLRRWLSNGLTQDNDTAHFKRAIPVKWNGIEYPSITHAARSIQVDRKVMEYYLAQGWRCNADIQHRKQACSWNGVQYESIHDAAVACGITDGGMKRRLKQGYTCDNDMSKPNLMNSDNLMDVQ